MAPHAATEPLILWGSVQLTKKQFIAYITEEQQMENFPTSWTPLFVAGYLPMIIVPQSPEPAKVQIEQRYAHGGGFYKFNGFNLVGDRDTPAGHLCLSYPDDLLNHEISRIHLPKTDELVVLFEGSFVAIIQANGDFEVTRMD